MCFFPLAGTNVIFVMEVTIQSTCAHIFPLLWMALEEHNTLLISQCILKNDMKVVRVKQKKKCVQRICIVSLSLNAVIQLTTAFLLPFWELAAALGLIQRSWSATPADLISHCS